VAQGQGSAVREALQQVLGHQAVEAAARKHGVVQRERKVRVFLLVWTLVLGFSVGDVRTLEGLRQLYQRSSGDTLSRSAFYERLSAKMAKMLYQLAQDALDALPDGPRLSHGPLAAFREVLAIDVLDLVLARNPRHHNALWQQLLREAPDPNIHRKDRAIQRVQEGAIA
jgi:hypothetical protein